MDILTLSLGSADGWSSATAAVVADRIVESGKIVTVAAGNDGASGSWDTSAPGSGREVISVGSVDKSVF
jgi:subtilisin family serine protease